MALRQQTPEELAKINTRRGVSSTNPAPASFGTGAAAMVSNPREKITTPAAQAASSVPKTYNSPGSSGLRQMTDAQKTARQGLLDANYSQNTTNPGMISNPREQQTASGGGVQQGTNVGGATAIPLSTSATNVPKVQEAQVTPPTPTQPPQVGQTPAPNAPGSTVGASTGSTPIDEAAAQQAQAQQQTAAANPDTFNDPMGAGQYYDAMVQGANDYLEGGQQALADQKGQQDNARALQLQQVLGATNAPDMLKAVGKNLNDLTLQELEQLAVSQGLDLSDADKQRIKQEGASAIESLGYEKGDRLAEVDFQKNQLERTMGRALTQREQFNAQQDTKMRRLANAFGMGKDLGANMETMRIAEEGQKALTDLSSEYADRQGLLGRQADAVIRQYYQGVKEVDNQVNGLIESKYAAIQNTVRDLIKQGVTDAAEIRKATFELNKEYIGLYNDGLKAKAEYMVTAQKQAFDEMKFAAEYQQKEDENLSQRFGVVFQDGQPVLDENGQPMSTFDAMKFETEQANNMYQFDAKLQQDAQQFSQRLGFDVSKEQYSQLMDQARFAQDQYQFETETGLKISEQEFNNLKFQADMADKGLSFGGGAVNTTAATSSFNPAKSKYGVTATPGGIQINVQTQTTANGKQRLVGNRVQCGEYVNDAIGIPSYFGNTLESKKARLTSQTPVPGSAFVTTEGVMYNGKPTGHVGIVEEVRPDGSIVISESNYDNQGSYRRKTYNSLEEFKNARKVVGFTGGLQQTQGTITKQGGAGTGVDSQVKSIISRKANLNQFPEKDRAAIAAGLTEYSKKAASRGDMYGTIEASVGGKDLGAQGAKLAQLDQTMNSLNALQSDIASQAQDPIGNIIRSNNPYDAKAKQIESQIVGLVPSLARGVFGEVGVLTDSDVKRYEGLIQSLGKTEATNQLIGEVLKKKLSYTIQSELKNKAASGYDVTGFGYLLDMAEVPRFATEQENQDALNAAGALASKAVQSNPLVKAGQGIFSNFFK